MTRELWVEDLGRRRYAEVLDLQRELARERIAGARPDTLLLVEHAHSVCLVVRAASTPRKAVLRATASLATAGHRPVGVILNRLPAHGGIDYYDGYGAKEAATETAAV